MITPKSPLPVHPHFAAKNTAVNTLYKKDEEQKEETPKEPLKEDVLHVNAEDVEKVEIVDEVPEGAEIHDGVELDGADEEVNPILDVIEAEAARKDAVAAAKKEKAAEE